LNINNILKKLDSMGSKKNKSKMGLFGIKTGNALGIAIPELRAFAKETGACHETALLLWKTGIHEARIMASMIDEKDKVADSQMEEWVNDFDSWDICDQVCDNLFSRTDSAVKKSIEWAGREGEFIKRAGFTMMAVLAWFRLGITDNDVEKMLSAIKKNASDRRNFVKKAVNWALRNIGKSGTRYYKQALNLAKELSVSKDKTARWVGLDALKELSKENIIKRAGMREKSFLKRAGGK
jgi:3-methyladenine DNA glycosylase AlkD